MYSYIILQKSQVQDPPKQKSYATPPSDTYASPASEIAIEMFERPSAPENIYLNSCHNNNITMEDGYTIPPTNQKAEENDYSLPPANPGEQYYLHPTPEDHYYSAIASPQENMYTKPVPQWTTILAGKKLILLNTILLLQKLFII